MKIVCENQEEYDNLMKACRYLHDFSFKTNKVKLAGIDFDDYPILSGIAHLYLSTKDFPDKDKYVTIKKKPKLKVKA